MFEHLRPHTPHLRRPHHHPSGLHWWLLWGSGKPHLPEQGSASGRGGTPVPQADTAVGLHSTTGRSPWLTFYCWWWYRRWHRGCIRMVMEKWGRKHRLLIKMSSPPNLYKYSCLWFFWVLTRCTAVFEKNNPPFECSLENTAYFGIFFSFSRVRNLLRWKRQ